MTQLTSGGGYSDPLWTADGRYILLRATGGMWWVRADGTGQPQPLTHSNNQQFPSSFTANGKRLAFLEITPASGASDFWTVSVESGNSGLRAGKPELFLQTPFHGVMPMISPDGRWMYFSAEVRGKFHTWRQRFPDGTVEQITSGVNEEEGTAITPDGRSLVTSVGTYETSIWVHNTKGDHQITSQGHAWYISPEASGRTVFSADGSRVYYLVDRRPQGGASELWFAEIRTGKNQSVVADSEQLGFDLSP